MKASHLLPITSFVVSFGVLLSTLFYAFSQNATMAKIVEQPLSQVELTESELVDKERNYPQLASWHVFGAYKEPVVAPQETTTVEVNSVAPVDLTSIPDTTVPLRLSGIVYSSDIRRAFAIIITPDGYHAEYRAGDSVENDIKIHLVEAERVVIDRGGKFEALNLPDPSSGSLQSPVRQAKRPTRPRNPNYKKMARVPNT